MIKDIRNLTYFMILMLSVITPSIANTLTKVTTNEDSILILDTILDDKPLISALDAYIVNDNLMLAVEPLFDSLALRYIREKGLLRVWKDQEITDFELSDKDSLGFWADDGFYLYLDHKTLSQLFDISINYSTSTLKLNIETNRFLFPSQKLEKLSYLRLMEQSATGRSKRSIDGTYLLADQYRLFTIPHGSFSLNARVDKVDTTNQKDTSFNYSVQTVSDLLYHSANLTLTDYKDQEATGRLNFSRFKSLPDELIAGAFDSYSFGDVNSISDNLTSNTQSGAGFVLTRAPEQYRNRNIGTTITEVARPGWDAELYRNGQFIELKKVPLDGNLIFEDVKTEYGSNHYEIKLYGPFGEKEVRKKHLVLDKNALSEGEFAYNIYALDNKTQLINNQNPDNFSFNNIGASASYGITNNWLVGLNYSSKENRIDQNEKLLTLKNSLAFPGLLFNNEISLQQDKGYAQISNLSGNAFGEDTFNFTFESSDDYQSDRIQSSGIERQYADLSYSGSPKLWHYSLGMSYLNTDNQEVWQARHSISKNISAINFSNNLFYKEDVFENNRITTWNGTLVAAGSLTQAVRLSAAIDYQPDKSDVIHSTSITLAWHDDHNFYHNLRGDYNLQKPNNKWRLNYNLSWNSEKFQLQLATNYDEESNWSVGLGIRFFLGYDYHNQKVILSNQLTSHSATLNSYSYLDRNPNGWRDEGDWDLAGVKFTGIPAWDNLESGETGRAVLPGVSTKVPFRFNAQWEYGTKAVAKNFLIYTHPGAYIDVNMPFYVTTDFSGFVYKVNYYQEQSPLTGVLFELLNSNNEVISTTSSDVDGYYQFSNFTPGNYTVKVTPEYLNQSGYTSNTIGYQFSTPSIGGNIELPAIIIKKLPINQKKLAESISAINTDNLSHETNIWLDSDDPNFGNVYSLSPSGNYTTQENTSEPDTLPDAPTIRTTLPDRPVNREQLPTQPVVRSNLPFTPVTRSQLPVQPVTRGELPIKPVVRALIPNKPTERAALPVEINISEQDSTTENSQPIATVATNNNFERNQTTIQADSQPKTLSLPMNTLYTLQLGAFSTQTSANKMLSQFKNLLNGAYIYQDSNKSEPLFRVFIGRFKDQQQASTYKKLNLPPPFISFVRPLPKQQTESESTASNGYVIQLIASPNKLKVISSAALATNMGEIFIAEKEIKGKTWYCLISQSFTNKKSAQRSLDASNLPTSAWVAKSSMYNNIVALSNK